MATREELKSLNNEKLKNIYEELEIIEEKLWELEKKTNEVFIKNKLFEIGNKISWLLLKMEEKYEIKEVKK